MKKILIHIFCTLMCSTIACQKTDISLEQAYLNNSHEELDRFFVEWASKSEPKRMSEYAKLDTIEKSIYAFFRDFYAKKYEYCINRSRLTDDYTRAEYIVIQNTIPRIFLISGKDTSLYEPNLELWLTHYVDAVNFEPKELEPLTNFRPNVKIKEKKTLFLFDEYEQKLNDFLFVDQFAGRGLRESPPDSLRREIMNRRDFITSKIVIVKNHWAWNWYYFTFPSIKYLSFSNDMKLLKVNAREGYASGHEFIYLNKNGTWIEIGEEGSWNE